MANHTIDSDMLVVALVQGNPVGAHAAGFVLHDGAHTLVGVFRWVK